MATERTTRPWYRRLSIWLLLLLLVYAFVTAGLLPWWLEQELPKRLDQHLGWQATVGDLQINPFTMTVEVTDLAASDSAAEPVLSFDSLDVNLGFWQLFRGVISLESIILEEPFIRVDLLEDYNVNFARDWQRNNPSTEAAQPSSDSDGGPPDLYFGRIALNGGELRLRDYSQENDAEFRIEPLNVELTDLANYPRDGVSDYTLTAAIGEQTVEWVGDLSLAPLESSGRLTVANVDSSTIWHFARAYLPYQLKSGKVTVSTDYELSLGNELALVTDGGAINIQELTLATANDESPAALANANIKADQIQFNLYQRELAVGAVSINGAAMNLRRDADGALNLVKPLAAGGDQEQTADTQSASGPSFLWSVEVVQVADSSLRWRDEQPATAADIGVEAINLTVRGLSDELAEPVDYEAEFGVAGGGQVAFRGQATPQPFTLETSVSGDKLALVTFEPYLQDAVALHVRDGRLSIDGSLALDGQTEPLTGTFSGQGRVDGLDVTLQNRDEPLLAWQSLVLEPIEYNLSPARLEIGKIIFSQPRVSVVRLKDGDLNVDRMVPSNNEAASDAQATAASDDASPGLIFRVGEIALADGEVEYADGTLDPVFATRLHSLNGSVTGLSNITPQRATVAIDGRIGEAGVVRFDGAIGTLGADSSSEIRLTMTELALPALSPYFGRYLGYNVDSGKLALNLDYKISGPLIKAENHVTLDRLQLGASVPSEQAVNAPVKLGLALLRDSQGIIDIDLPIEGDLNNPDFRLGQVVMRTFVNLVAKAATSPFSMLGSIADLAGLSGAELGAIRFEPGQTQMASGETQKLEVLAKALSERPELLLNIRGAVAPELDEPALKKRRLFKELGIGSDASMARRIAQLERAYQEAADDAPLNVLRQQAQDARNTNSLSNDQWESVLAAALAKGQALPSDALRSLAVARGNWLQGQLLETYDIPSEQLFVLDPLLDAPVPDGQDQVTVQFQLDAR